MSVFKYTILVIALGLALGCGTKPPLPEDELPNDFLFSFTHERLADFGETIELPADDEGAGEADSSEVADSAKAPDATEKPGEVGLDSLEVKQAPPPKNVEETAPEAGEEGADESKPMAGKGETVTLPLPSLVKVTVDVLGRTDIDVTHVLPRETKSRHTITLSKKHLMELYQLIRAADLYNMLETYEGGDISKGKETFFVIGRNKPTSVTVTGTSIESLTKIRDRLLEVLPVKDLLTQPAVVDRLVIMDRRTGVFYQANEPEVGDIPEQYKKIYKDPWRALNDGGFPSPNFGPMPKEWD